MSENALTMGLAPSLNHQIRGGRQMIADSVCYSFETEGLRGGSESVGHCSQSSGKDLGSDQPSETHERVLNQGAGYRELADGNDACLPDSVSGVDFRIVVVPSLEDHTPPRGWHCQVRTCCSATLLRFTHANGTSSKLQIRVTAGTT